MVLKVKEQRCRLCIIALLVVFIKQTQGQTASSTTSSGPSSTSNYFAPLDDLSKYPNPRGLANQNFTRCCLRAVDEWNKDLNRQHIEVLSSQKQTGFKPFANREELSKTEEQFPCGAEYNHNKEGATRVKISYMWCKQNCGGWERSRSAVLEQWVQPFVGFILPAAVFCLNVPRKMVIDISDNLFPNILEDLDTHWSNYIEETNNYTATEKILPFIGFIAQCILVVFLLCIRAALAAGIGFLNVVVWVIVVFSMAAPMILSGLYEATIDRQVLRAVEKDVAQSGLGKEKKDKRNNPDKVKYHIHLLYAVLVGNLSLWENSGQTSFPAKLKFWKRTKKSTSDEETPSKPPPEKLPETTEITEDEEGTKFKAPTDRVWGDVKNMLKDLQPGKDLYEGEKPRTEARLKTMLQCQASFGATVGAPVAFYLGSFLFSVFGNHEKLGDSNVSLSLAFGEWWMTIPHVAIVSGCLLAGNNPNTLEAIVSGMQMDLPKHEPESRVWASFYKSVYQPVWMWERGRNKRVWIKKVQKEYGDPGSGEPLNTKAVGWFKRYLTTTDLSSVPKVGRLGWAILIVTASILVVIPFVLAYVTSFYTPTIGLSCRTFTFVLYFVFQSLLTIMWAYDFSFDEKETHFFHYDGPQRSSIPFALTLLFFIGSSFTAIIGTFMQILGVYRNCLCNLPMGYWGSRDYAFTVSTNTAEGIHYAGLYWLSTGIASICLLVLFCYFGWWYQRHWRHRFTKVVDDVLDVEKVIKEKAPKGKTAKKTTTGKPPTENVTKDNSLKGNPAPDIDPQTTTPTKLPTSGGQVTTEDRDVIKPIHKEPKNTA